MLDKLINKLLDFFTENKMVDDLEAVPVFKETVQKFKDRAFMVHIIKYLFFGVLTTVISLGSFWILIKITTLNENICNFISIVAGILSAYILNRNYVFESKEENIFKEFSKFVMARALSSLFDMITFFIFATCLSLNEMLVKIVISIVVVILNYFLSKIMVFNKNTK